MSTAQLHRKRTVEWMALEVLGDHPEGLFVADLHRIIEERTTIALDMHRLLDAVRRLRKDRKVTASWEGARQRFSIREQPALS